MGVGETARVEVVVDVHTGGFRFRYLSLLPPGRSASYARQTNREQMLSGKPAIRMEAAVIKITGLKELQKKMDDLAKFASEMDGELARVSFDPSDPSSIETAIQAACDAVDERANSYPRNDMVQNLAEQAKESFREQILERAAAARLEADEE
ncbi:hypothetical protein N0B44_33950 [Roseibacterium beibuensis]|uniref:hypothetical protein n=1 Tax=[Roseibacterium] beibuensis TaxID=1193142 RepID=UPI00217CCB62|nr:hypothetical protein [Roseibacterium beibuensis]MCS6627917.1 hypothetical protein [Roseibacterium beibuensis]